MPPMQGYIPATARRSPSPAGASSGTILRKTNPASQAQSKFHLLGKHCRAVLFSKETKSCDWPRKCVEDFIPPLNRQLLLPPLSCVRLEASPFLFSTLAP